jgi:predicted nucleotidyltransferase
LSGRPKYVNRRYGIRSLVVFGSVARGDAGRHRDVDVVIELEPTSPMGLLEHARLADELGGLFGRRVDLSLGTRCGHGCGRRLSERRSSSSRAEQALRGTCWMPSERSSDSRQAATALVSMTRSCSGPVAEPPTPRWQWACRALFVPTVASSYYFE